MFKDVESEMRGLKWGQLYETYKKSLTTPRRCISGSKRALCRPIYKKTRRIFEYILGGSKDFKLLEVRVFDEATKRAAYARQKHEAEGK